MNINEAKKYLETVPIFGEEIDIEVMIRALEEMAPKI